MDIEPNNLRVWKYVIRGIREPTLPSKEFFILVIRHYAVIYAHTIQVLGVANVRILPVPGLRAMTSMDSSLIKAFAALRGRLRFLAGLIELDMCFTSMSPGGNIKKYN